jgi:hypothetical protein
VKKGSVAKKIKIFISKEDFHFKEIADLNFERGNIFH